MASVRRRLVCSPCKNRGYAEWQSNTLGSEGEFNAIYGRFSPARIQPAHEDVFLCDICRCEALRGDLVAQDLQSALVEQEDHKVVSGPAERLDWKSRWYRVRRRSHT